MAQEDIMRILRNTACELRGALLCPSPCTLAVLLCTPCSCSGSRFLWSAILAHFLLQLACKVMQELHHYTDLDIGLSLPRLSARNLTALQFQQQFVTRNKPVVLTDAVEHWPALKLWSAEYLLQRVGDVQVVPCTPVTPLSPLPEHA